MYQARRSRPGYGQESACYDSRPLFPSSTRDFGAAPARRIRWWLWSSAPLAAEVTTANVSAPMGTPHPKRWANALSLLVLPPNLVKSQKKCMKEKAV